MIHQGFKEFGRRGGKKIGTQCLKEIRECRKMRKEGVGSKDRVKFGENKRV